MSHPFVFRMRAFAGATLLLLCVLPFDRASAETDAEAASPPRRTANEVARELANPNTPLASLTLKNQLNLFEGDLPNADDQTSGLILLQPVLPFPLDNGDRVIFRPAIPLQLGQPIFDPDRGSFDSETGLGDIAFDLAYAKSAPGGLLVAAGLISSLPTSTQDDLGKERWTLGPEVLLGHISKHSIFGVFPNHQWDVAGPGGGDVSLTTIQVFAIGLPGGGWNAGSSPIMTYDHEAEEWIIPLNVTAGRTVVLGGRPWKFAAELNYYVERPGGFGPQWMFGFNVTPVVENRLAGFLSGLFER